MCRHREPPHADPVTRTEIVVRGQLADSIVSVIGSRFGALAISPDPSGLSARIVGDLDQAAERALLTLLWDTGHEVLSLRSLPTHDYRNAGGEDEREDG